MANSLDPDQNIPFISIFAARTGVSVPNLCLNTVLILNYRIWTISGFLKYFIDFSNNQGS